MSDQIENENQQTASPEEVRQYILAELEASKQTIAELSDEQLEQVAGGAAGWGAIRNVIGKGHLAPLPASAHAATPAAAHAATPAATPMMPKTSFKQDLKAGAIQGAAFLGLSYLLTPKSSGQ